MNSAPNLVKPRALRPGSTIAIVSPASAAKQELVHRGITRLHALGYKTILGRHALDSGPLYYAGKLEDRLHDLHAAFSNPAVDAILCTRGGWGSAELLPYLDAALLHANPKPFIGYSDHTALHLWLQTRANLVTFHGPMAAADLSRGDGADLASWRNSLHGEAETWSLDKAAGLRTLRPGHAEGILTGGCLAIYAEAIGTPYAPRISRPSILFLEDIGVKPFQWDRMILHLRYASLLEGVTGIVFGDMSQCVPPDQEAYLDQAILHALRDFSGPIAIGLRSGHVASENVTLPFGIATKLNLIEPESPSVHFLESAVTA